MAKKVALTDIQTTLLALSAPDLKPKDLLKKVRKVHPSASKGEIVRAAFATMIAVVDKHPDKATLLQDFALKERASDGTD